MTIYTYIPSEEKRDTYNNCEDDFIKKNYTFLAEPGDIFYSFEGSVPHRVGLFEVYSVGVNTDGIIYECGEYELEKKTFQGKSYIDSSFLWRHKYSEDYFKKHMFRDYANASKMFLLAKKKASEYYGECYSDDCIAAEEIEKYAFKPANKFNMDIDLVMMCAEMLSRAIMYYKQCKKTSGSPIIDVILPELNEATDSYYKVCFDSDENMREEFKALINERLIDYLVDELNIYEGDSRRLVAYTRYCYVSLKYGTMFHISNKPLPDRIEFWENGDG